MWDFPDRGVPLHRFKKWLSSLYLLNLFMLRPEYSGKMRSLPWLPMPWRLASPGHRHQWYWLLPKRTLVFSQEEFQLSVPSQCREMIENVNNFLFPRSYAACKGLTLSNNLSRCWDHWTTSVTRVAPIRVCICTVMGMAAKVPSEWNVGQM